MAEIQPEVNDGGSQKNLKYKNYLEDVPGVNKYFFNRCYNAADSEVYKARGKAASKLSRQTYLTYVKALEKLARRICLDPDEPLSQPQVAEITRTRDFLGPDFFEHMGFHGVSIVSSAGIWAFRLTQSAEVVATRLDIYID